MFQNSELNGLSAKQLQMKDQVKQISIIQLVLAINCIILGVIGTVFISLGQSGQYSYSYHVTLTGSGIWSSIFTVAASGTGLRAGSLVLSRLTIVAHLVLAIIGSVFELSGFIISAMICVSSSNLGFQSVLAVYIILCFLSITNFCLLITTSVLSCKLLKCCCGSSTGSGHEIRFWTFVPQTITQTPGGMVVIQPPQGFLPQYNETSTNSQLNTVIQPQKIRVAPPSYF